MIVIADATPLNYLVLIHQAHLLPLTLTQLQATTFYVRPELIRSLLEEDAVRKKRRRRGKE
jgi:hypothetical protein